MVFRIPIGALADAVIDTLRPLWAGVKSIYATGSKNKPTPVKR